MRLVLVGAGLVAVFVLSYFLWGDHFERLLAGNQAKDWFLSFDPWTWAVAILLLMADVLLPIPATAVLATLGLIYGPLIGGFVGCAGTFLAGSVAYLLCRGLGDRVAVFLLGRDTLERGHRFFTSAGGWLVALSRWMIILPEMVSCVAGLTRMPARKYFAALACGTVPMSFTYATIGALHSDRPILALAVSAAVPVFLWPVAQWLLTRRSRLAAGEASRP